jgi:hypothetical protein
MKPVVVSSFHGIAPRYAPGLKPGFAQEALNCDISDGKLGPVNGHLPVGTGSGDSLHYHGGSWFSGTGRHYLSWMINSIDLLFYLDDSGTPMKSAEGVTATLGQDLPGAPTVASQSPRAYRSDDDIPSGYKYAFRQSSTTTEWYVVVYNQESGTVLPVLMINPDPPYFYDLDPGAVFVNDNEFELGTLGSLDYDQWAVGDQDSLGFDTVYVRISGLTSQVIDGATVAFFSDNSIGSFLAVENPGGVNDTVKYALTMTRSVGGHEDESGLGELSDELTMYHGVVRVTRPTVSDSSVISWTIFRIGDLSGEYQKVATVDIGTSYYDDSLDASEVGDAPTTYYTSDQGNEIIFSKPETFTGIVGPHAGMLFGWKDSTLYWNEPGKPDAWPPYYSMNFPSQIKRVIFVAGALAVLTETGPFRVDGTHPELLVPSEPLGTEPFPCTAAVKTSKGIMFLSDSGMTLFNLYDTSVISDSMFTEKWFSSINTETAFMAENDGAVYLFHDAGVLKLDTTSGKTEWTTLDIIATAAFKRPDNGKLYFLSSGIIREINGGDDVVEFNWLSGDFLIAGSDDTEFDGVTVVGAGDVTLSVYVDGNLKAARSLDFSMDRGRTVRLRPEHAGRALSFRVAGTGRVTEVMVQ